MELTFLSNCTSQLEKIIFLWENLSYFDEKVWLLPKNHFNMCFLFLDRSCHWEFSQLKNHIDQFDNNIQSTRNG